MPFATGLGTLSNIRASSSLALTTAGVATGRSTIFLFSVPPPITAFSRSNFFKLYTTTNSPYSLATFNIMRFSGRAVLTPGFQASPNISIIRLSGSMGQSSANISTNGSLTNFQYGMPVHIDGPPSGVQIPFNSLGLATTIAASGNTTSVVIPSFYYPHIIAGITSTQAGALNIQRYIDVAGLIANGAALTTSLIANTAAVSDNLSTLGFGSFTVQITNTGTIPATISGYALLLLAR